MQPLHINSEANMSIIDRYNGTAEEIQVALNEQKPDSYWIGTLIVAALRSGNENLFTALIEYVKAKNDVINDSQKQYVISRLLSLTEVKQYSTQLKLFLHPNAALDGPTDHDLGVNLILMHYAESLDPHTKFNRERPQLKHRYLKEALEKTATFHNTLTIYHDTIHAFVKLECTECSDGMPAFIVAGLYPPDEETKTCPLENQDEPYKAEKPMMSYFPVAKSALGIGSYSYGMHSSPYAKAPKSVVYSLGGSCIYRSDNDLGDRYELIIEHTSFIVSGWYHLQHTSPYINIDKVHKKSFNISTEAAARVVDRIVYLANHCDRDYQYKVLGNNCLDFAQHIYNVAGLRGDHFYEMYPSDSYPLGIFGVYKVLTDV